MPKQRSTNLAQRTRARREELGLTQQELANELGVTAQHVSRIELGQVAPSLELLVRLSQQLGVSADYLLTGQQTAPLDTTVAIRANPTLSQAAKKALITLLDELARDAER